MLAAYAVAGLLCVPALVVGSAYWRVSGRLDRTSDRVATALRVLWAAGIGLLAAGPLLVAVAFRACLGVEGPPPPDGLVGFRAAAYATFAGLAVAATAIGGTRIVVLRQVLG